MRFMLKTLTLDGKEIPFSYAWLDWEREGCLNYWSGFVRGGDDANLVGPEVRLAAETADGRQVTGQVFVESVNGGDFSFKATGTVLVNGQELDE